MEREIEGEIQINNLPRHDADLRQIAEDLQ